MRIVGNLHRGRARRSAPSSKNCVMISRPRRTSV
jgi:hypothetical protein